VSKTTPVGIEGFSSEKTPSSDASPRRFIECKTVRNGINIIAEPNLHECTPYIIRDKSLLHVMENAPNERRGGIIAVHRKLGSHPLLEDTTKTKVKGLKDICGRRWESHSLDSVSGNFL
jgi:hypothetical protein